jgi:hypothetical protein
MATQYVTRESMNTKSRHVTPTYMDKDEAQRVVGSSDPMPTVDVNHLRLHEGRAYYVYKLYPYSAGLGAGSSINIAVAWPAGIFPHAVFSYESPGEAEFFMYESPTTSGGTAMTIYRRNRNLVTTSSGAAVLDPTVSNTGTEIYAEFVPAGNKGGGQLGFTFEYVLKPLTTYLFRFTNVNSQAHPANMRIEWYE